MAQLADPIRRQQQQPPQQPTNEDVSALTYPGWQDDQHAAERIYLDSPPHSSLFHEKIVAMQTKQRFFEGDRSRLVAALDAVPPLTYEGHEDDQAQAERRLSGDCTVLQLGLPPTTWVQKMIKKQQACTTNERVSNPYLHQLDALALTYPGWEEDKATAEHYYTEYHTPVRFTQKITAMTHKQRLYDGDRSHPEIAALDDAVAHERFTYESWQDDHRAYLERHTGDCTLFQLGITCEFLWSKMVKKQQLHEDRSSLPLLQTLDQCHFSYPGWEADKIQAEGYLCEFTRPDRFHDKVQAMQHKQRLLVDQDRSHPDLVALDGTDWSYPGWEADKVEAEQRHTGDCTVLQLGGGGFAVALAKMNQRQAHHEGKQLPSSSSSSTTTTTTTTMSLVDLAFRRPHQQQQQACFSPAPTTVCAVGVDSNPADNDVEAAVTTTRVCDEKTCVVCLEDEPRYAFIPCGHLCVCPGCVPRLEERQGPLQCPMCRETAMVLTRIFA